MVTLNDIRSLPRDELRESIAAMKRDVRKLDELKSGIDNPQELVKAFRKAVGADRADVVLASLVNGCSWDGRICVRVRNWAAGIPDAWTEDAMREWGIDTTMHRAHLDQTCWYMGR